MTQTDTRSLQEIRRDTERTRAGLTNTVEELRSSVTETANDIRERIRPEAIKAEVSDYIRSRGEQMLDDLTAAARRNPLQAVALATTLGYPLLRMARAIPVPILMVGAGLFLAGSKTARAATQQASDYAADLTDEAMRRSQNFRDEVGQRASAVKSYATDQIDRLSGAVASGTDRISRTASDARTTLSSGSEQLQDTASSVGASVADRAAGLKDQGLRMAASAADAAREAAADAAATGRKLAGDARDRSLEAMRMARDTASDLGSRAGTTVTQTIEQNPLLVAGVGLAIGGLIASALPRTTLETGLAGAATGELKRRAQAAAAGGYEAAKNAVSDVVGKATQQVQAEGLDPDGLDRTARDLGQKVRRVAEAAVTTAFDPSQQQQRSNVSGDNSHG
jgi:hypothetical protein